MAPAKGLVCANEAATLRAVSPAPAPSPIELPAADAPLAQILATAWQLLAAGATDPAEALHWPVLATVSHTSTPDARVVVLRAVEAAQREIEVHSDRRAGKLAQLAITPQACVVGYDPTRQIQLRLWGTTRVHQGDAPARAAWTRLGSASQRSYLAPNTPGTAVDHPASNLPAQWATQLPSPEEAEPGFAQFALIVLRIEALEWLRLGRAGHQRARFEWPVDQPARATYLHP